MEPALRGVVLGHLDSIRYHVDACANRALPPVPGPAGDLCFGKAILYARRTASGWSRPAVVNSFAGTETPPNEGDVDPVLAVQDNGVVHVAWLGRYHSGGPDVGTHIFYARRGAGGSL